MARSCVVVFTSLEVQQWESYPSIYSIIEKCVHVCVCSRVECAVVLGLYPVRRTDTQVGEAYSLLLEAVKKNKGERPDDNMTELGDN